LEELAEGIVKSILRLIGVVIRSLIWLIWELCFEIIGWYVGWPICRAISFGYYPKESINDQEQVNHLSGFIVSLVGIVALLLTATLIAKLVGSG
tara:strand:+ start:61 stop:342 length:282 start_codon:yes stop_codon:yes gene_type:complete